MHTHPEQTQTTPSVDTLSRKDEKEWCIRTLKHLRESSFLCRQKNDGTFATIAVSEDLARLLETTVAHAQETLAINGLLTMTHQEDRIFIRRMLRRRVNEENGSNLIVRVKTMKGNILWCDIHFSFVTDFDHLYVYCTFFDITTLKEYEHRLRSAYTNFGTNFYQSDATTLGLFQINLSKDTIENMQGRDLYGTDSTMTPYSVFLKKRSDNLPIPEEREQLLELFDPDELLVQYLKGFTLVQMTVYSRRPNGQNRYVTLTSNTIRHPLTGDIIAFLAEKDANTAKVKEMLLSKILSRQFDMVAWLTEGNYGVVIGDAANIKNGSIFPLTRQGNYQAYLSSQVVPVLHGSPVERETMLAQLRWDTIAAKIAVQSPYIVNIAVNVDGAIWYKRFDFYAVDSAGRFCIVLKSDTTDIQRQQREINEQLKQALTEAQQASVAKTTFLSRMSHEIRTPMNAIIGLGTLALREPDITPHLREYLTKIGSSARYLLSLINDILDMSRIESGRMVLKNEQFSFRSFLDLVNTMLDGQCRERGLTYSCVVEGVIDEFYIGDDTKLRQILINILGNSVKFTNPGGKVSLTVCRTSSLEGQANLRFTIEDTGIGMDASYLPKIFEPFSQEDASNTTKYGGSGLGLAITKNIVTLLNGEITVASEKGKGTRFTINVPLRETKHATTKNFAINPKELTVLLVDHDPASAKHTHAVLEDIGIAATLNQSGEQALHTIALHTARRDPFTLILLDLRLPDKDALSLAKEIRAQIGDQSTILLTAYSLEGIEEEAKKNVCDGVVTKPIFASALLDIVRKALVKKSSQTDEDTTPADLTNRHILLAEDVAINAEIMIQLLEILNITVEHAENGALAVEAFAKSAPFSFDAILMDVRMPVLDGLGACRKIRALNRADAKTIPIIAMTANAFDEDVQHSLKAGMNAHLTKPVDPEQLQTTLAQLIADFDHTHTTSPDK